MKGSYDRQLHPWLRSHRSSRYRESSLQSALLKLCTMARPTHTATSRRETPSAHYILANQYHKARPRPPRNPASHTEERRTTTSTPESLTISLTELQRTLGLKTVFGLRVGLVGCGPNIGKRSIVQSVISSLEIKNVDSRQKKQKSGNFQQSAD